MENLMCRDRFTEIQNELVESWLDKHFPDGDYKYGDILTAFTVTAETVEQRMLELAGN
jgi:hypothetical protein